MSELKPCPFCGNAGEILQSDYGFFYVGCSTPKCLMNVDYSNHAFSTEEKAEDAWNRRAE